MKCSKMKIQNQKLFRLTARAGRVSFIKRKTKNNRIKNKKRIQFKVEASS